MSNVEFEKTDGQVIVVTCNHLAEVHGYSIVKVAIPNGVDRKRPKIGTDVLCLDLKSCGHNCCDNGSSVRIKTRPEYCVPPSITPEKPRKIQTDGSVSMCLDKPFRDEDDRTI